MTYAAAEQPTLRLTTLRTLTRHGAPVAVVHVSTPICELAPLIEGERVSIVAVDGLGMLRGVLSYEEAVAALVEDRDGWVADHMNRAAIALDAESELAEACSAIAAAGAEHVLVVTPRGLPLGVISAAVLATYRLAA